MMVVDWVRLEIEAEKFRRERVDYTAICGRSSRVWKPATGGEVVVGTKGLVSCCCGQTPGSGRKGMSCHVRIGEQVCDGWD
jgi:hypothetical protein